MDDDVEVSLEFQPVGGEEGLDEFAEMHINVAGAGWSEVRAVSGTHNCDAA